MQPDFKHLSSERIPTHDTEARLNMKYLMTEYESKMQEQRKKKEEMEEED